MLEITRGGISFELNPPTGQVTMDTTASSRERSIKTSVCVTPNPVNPLQSYLNAIPLSKRYAETVQQRDTQSNMFRTRKMLLKWRDQEDTQSTQQTMARKKQNTQQLKQTCLLVGIP